MEQWQVKRTTKVIKYRIRKLNKSDYFGHQEILNGQTHRTTQVVCKTKCQIFYINKADFLEQFH